MVKSAKVTLSSGDAVSKHEVRFLIGDGVSHI